jgi:hypothetical protein
VWLTALYAGASQASSTPNSSQTTNAQSANAPQNGPAQLSDSQRQQIRNQAYQVGYADGQMDKSQSKPFDFESHAAYSQANQGYDANSGVDLETYRMNFRSGYEAGYDDGYNGRDSNPTGNQNRTYSASPTPGNPPQTAPTTANRASATTQPPQSNGPHVSGTIPAGTAIQVKLNNTVSTRSSAAGDSFTATVSQPVTDARGNVLVPIGSLIEGTVASVNNSGGVTGNSTVQLRFERLQLPDGHQSSLAATVTNVNTGPTTGAVAGVIEGTPTATPEGGVQQSNTRRTAGASAAGGAVGAVIGAMAGGGKGAAIGTIVGAAAGLGAVLVTKNRSLDLPAGTLMTIKLTQPVYVH